MPTTNRPTMAATIVRPMWRLRLGAGAPGSKPMVRLTNSASFGVFTMSGFHWYPGGGALFGSHPGICGDWLLTGAFLSGTPQACTHGLHAVYRRSITVR